MSDAGISGTGLLAASSDKIRFFANGPASLHIWPMDNFIRNRILSAADDYNLGFHVAEDRRAISIPITHDTSASLVSMFQDRLSVDEVGDIRALVTAPDQWPTLDEVRHVISLKHWLNLAGAYWLRQLIDEQRLLAYFQPIVDVRSLHHVFAYEALLRGKMDEEAIVSAGAIFSTAREADLLGEIDRAARLNAIRAAGKGQLRTALFLNFNPTVIFDPEDALRVTNAAIRDAGLQSSQVVFEVTETDTVSNTLLLNSVLNHYRARGFRIALDDVGAGFSSLNLMHHIKPDFIKLDMDLIHNVDSDPFKGRLVQNLITTAHQLGISTIAEGVETADEVRWLRNRGVDFVQGFYISRPAPLPDGAVNGHVSIDPPQPPQ